ncbi:lipopolysaccharide transport periplasmic protein LptA [Helicobacter sp. 12S02634-8]|uniref:lipopolysaccharide transport periplasmic protein LptA n=1 Tax=Helicobacter sp. 12S02634-8 TaxID=1476199 RepID=UPI000BA75338|nr:lipopolysaccharide transport periplasmic protein LptA [Helicobacter sp. 12S02634-8]PAF46619.1 lipopolysaccharide transport periplasmic protein LptA [Helicobacter sp. 12S02634-8]
MKKTLLLLCVLMALVVYGKETLEVTADKFSSDDTKGITTIEGQVHITKGKDTLQADKVIIYTDKKRTPQSYEAMGNVKFHIFMENGREIQGHSDKLIYNATNGEYRLLENAVVNEVGKANTIRGEEIIVNNDSGYANVIGSKNKPAKFIFNLDDMEQNNKTHPTPTPKNTEKNTQQNPTDKPQKDTNPKEKP